MFKGLILTLCVSLFLLLSCDDNSTSIDKNFGKIYGTVITVSSNPISGVEISTNPPTEVILTNAKGYFDLTHLPEGIYIVYAKKLGLKSKFVTVTVIKGKSTEAVIIMDEQSTNNQTPYKPTLLQPANNSSTNNQSVTFKWSCDDPDGDDLYYTLYMGDNVNSLPIIEDNIISQEFQLSNIDLNKKFYWKIVATDSYGNTSTSDVWNFTTVEQEIKSSLVLYLKFNSNISDNSQYNQNVNQSKVTFVKDRYGNDNSAAYFSGNSYVEVSNPAAMDFSNPFTIAAWIRPDEGYGNAYDNEVDIVGRYGAAASGKSSFALSIQDGFLKTEIFHPNSGRNILQSSAFLLPNVWKFISLVYNGQELRLYVNGQMVGNRTTYQPDKSNLSLLIGKRSTQNRYYQGAIDDMIIYNDALNDDEILNLFK